MHHTVRARLGTAALLVSALGLVAPAAAPAGAAVAAHHTVARAAVHHTPKLVFRINKAGTIRLVHGPRTFRPGRIAFAVTSADPNASLAFARFAKGYGFRGFRKDLAAAFGKGDMGALKHAIRKSRFFGGAGNAGGGFSGTVVLPRAGTYTLYNFGGNSPKSPFTLHAVGSPVRRAMPRTTGTLKAMTGIRWGGASSLAHRGSLLFKNASSDSPHFLELDQVKPGTTKKQIVDFLNSGSNQQPPFFIRPGLATEVVSPHQSMTVRYNLPRGTYAEMCFFPDPNNHGMPHAAMGMVRIITLK